MVSFETMLLKNVDFSSRREEEKLPSRSRVSLWFQPHKWVLQQSN